MIPTAVITACVASHGAVLLFGLTDAQVTNLRTLASRRGLRVRSLAPRPACYWQRTVGGQWNATHDVIVTGKETGQ